LKVANYLTLPHVCTWNTRFVDKFYCYPSYDYIVKTLLWYVCYSFVTIIYACIIIHLLYIYIFMCMHTIWHKIINIRTCALNSPTLRCMFIQVFRWEHNITKFQIYIKLWNYTTFKTCSSYHSKYCLLFTLSYIFKLTNFEDVHRMIKDKFLVIVFILLLTEHS